MPLCLSTLLTERPRPLPTTIPRVARKQNWAFREAPSPTSMGPQCPPIQYNTLQFNSGPACGRCRWFVFHLQWLVSAPWALQMICFSSAMLRKPYNYNVFGNCCCVEMLQSLHFYIRSGSAMQIKCKFTLILNEVIPMDIYIQLCYMTNICCNAKSIWVSGKGRGSGLGVENTCRLKQKPE